MHDKDFSLIHKPAFIFNVLILHKFNKVSLFQLNSIVEFF